MSTQITISPVIKLEVNTTPITGGSAGQILFQTTGNTVGESANLFWDNPNGRLGVGTSSPSFVLDVNGVSRIQTFQSGTPTILNIHNQETNGLPGGAIAFYTGGSSSSASRIVSQRTGPIGESDIALETTGVKRLFVTATSGNIGINTTTDAGYKLDVNGTARVVGQATIQTLTVGLGGGAVATNTALGLIALLANTTGTANTALGHTSLSNNTTGAGNTAIGFNSLNGTNGTNNSGLGNSTLRHITSGSLNTAVGAEAGRYIADGVTNLTTCDNSVFLGMSARPLANSQTNQIAIGHNAIGAGSNTATLGNTSIVDTILRGRINLQQYATGSRPTYVKGALIYDSTLSKLVVGGATGWEVVTSI